VAFILVLASLPEALRLWELPAWDLRELAAGRADLQPSRAGSAAGHGDAAPQFAPGADQEAG